MTDKITFTDLDINWDDIYDMGDLVSSRVKKALMRIHFENGYELEEISLLCYYLENNGLIDIEIQEIVFFVRNWRINNNGGFLPDCCVCNKCEYRKDLCICEK